MKTPILKLMRFIARYQIDTICARVNILRTAQNTKHLDEGSKELSQLAPDVSIRTLSLDAATLEYMSVEKCIKDLNVSLLVNNVGVHNPIPTNTEDMDLFEVNRIVSVNCTFQVQLTTLIIPQLKKTASAGRPASIINVSSLTSRMAMPMLSVYAATKAFEEHWTTNLAAELQPSNIEVLCVRPGLTVSQMSGISQPTFFCPSAAKMAYACLSMLGVGDVSVAPYWPHALLDYVNEWVPGKLLSWPAVRKMHQQKRDALVKYH